MKEDLKIRWIHTKCHSFLTLWPSQNSSSRLIRFFCCLFLANSFRIASYLREGRFESPLKAYKTPPLSYLVAFTQLFFSCHIFLLHISGEFLSHSFISSGTKVENPTKAYKLPRVSSLLKICGFTIIITTSASHRWVPSSTPPYYCPSLCPRIAHSKWHSFILLSFFRHRLCYCCCHFFYCSPLTVLFSFNDDRPWISEHQVEFLVYGVLHQIFQLSLLLPWPVSHVYHCVWCFAIEEKGVSPRSYTPHHAFFMEDCKTCLEYFPWRSCLRSERNNDGILKNQWPDTITTPPSHIKSIWRIQNQNFALSIRKSMLLLSQQPIIHLPHHSAFRSQLPLTQRVVSQSHSPLLPLPAHPFHPLHFFFPFLAASSFAMHLSHFQCTSFLRSLAIAIACTSLKFSCSFSLQRTSRGSTSMRCPHLW